ncbi:MAG: NAD+ synthase, partial [Alphaproteobacteria bacterium]
MPDHLKIALAQLNPTVGDIPGNLDKLRRARAQAAQAGADLVVFTELFLTGYPPEDLVLKPALQRAAMTALNEVAAETADRGPAVIVGTPWLEDGKLYNAAALLDRGEIAGLRHKVDLPNYGVFDEVRVFAPGPMPGPVNFRGVRLGLPVCEDIWTGQVAECLEETGAELFIVINGSPWDQRKYDVRLGHAVARVTESGLPLIYVNQFGGQDELAFDGASFVLNGDRSMPVQLPAWEECVAMTEWRRGENGWVCEPAQRTPAAEDLEAAYLAVLTGLRDYIEKNRFPSVVIGLSGGIDSALTAALAVDALGAERVQCFMLPSRFTSRESTEDAQACARALGVELGSLPIDDSVDTILHTLGHVFGNRPPDQTEENIQARVRGLLLMAVSNKLGPMVLTTGNKSEMSVGYATLYGDMNGGFNPLKDLYKTQVYALARWRNGHRPKGAKGPEGEVVPERIITKPPSAELRADQKDQDTLPPYEVLDDILQCLVEEEMSVREVTARGHDEKTVRRIEHMLYVAEYKRRQSAPGVKISHRHFGRDRRYPITNAFRD